MHGVYTTYRSVTFINMSLVTSTDGIEDIRFLFTLGNTLYITDSMRTIVHIHIIYIYIYIYI